MHPYCVFAFLCDSQMVPRWVLLKHLMSWLQKVKINEKQAITISEIILCLNNVKSLLEILSKASQNNQDLQVILKWCFIDLYRKNLEISFTLRTEIEKDLLPIIPETVQKQLICYSCDTLKPLVTHLGKEKLRKLFSTLAKTLPHPPTDPINNFWSPQEFANLFDCLNKSWLEQFGLLFFGFESRQRSDFFEACLQNYVGERIYDFSKDLESIKPSPKVIKESLKKASFPHQLILGEYIYWECSSDTSYEELANDQNLLFNKLKNKDTIERLSSQELQVFCNSKFLMMTTDQIIASIKQISPEALRILKVKKEWNSDQEGKLLKVLSPEQNIAWTNNALYTLKR